MFFISKFYWGLGGWGNGELGNGGTHGTHGAHGNRVNRGAGELGNSDGLRIP